MIWCDTRQGYLSYSTLFFLVGHVVSTRTCHTYDTYVLCLWREWERGWLLLPKEENIINIIFWDMSNWACTRTKGSRRAQSPGFWFYTTTSHQQYVGSVRTPSLQVCTSISASCTAVLSCLVLLRGGARSGAAIIWGGPVLSCDNREALSKHPLEHRPKAPANTMSQGPRETTYCCRNGYMYNEDIERERHMYTWRARKREQKKQGQVLETSFVYTAVLVCTTCRFGDKQLGIRPDRVKMLEITHSST